MALTEPTTDAGRGGLAALIAEPARSVVAVDFDGTLAPIVTRPDQARPAPGAVEALRALATRVGCVAVISGRGADDVVSLAGFDSTAGLCVLGHYGLERWSDGRLTTPPVAPGIAEARRRLIDVVAAAPEGVHLEDKHHSLVLHTRPAADPPAALEALRAPAAQIAAAAGLEVVPGRLVLELRPPGVDKGSALHSLATELGAAAVLYAGDDLGDLPAYDAVDRLRAAGTPGITLASVDPALDDAPAELAARADLVLAGPGPLVGWLAELAAAIGEP